MTAPVVLVTMRDGDEADRIVDLGSRLKRLEVTDVDSGTDTAKMTIENGDLSLLDDVTWKKGQKLEIAWGIVGDLRPPRPFLVERVRGFDVLTVELSGSVSSLNREKRTRAFLSSTLSDVVLTVAREHGYSGRSANVEPTSLLHDVVNQVGETDARFLARLARRHGFRFRVDDDGLLWGPRKLDVAPVLSFEYRIGGDVLRVETDSDVALQPAVVTLKGINPETGQPFEVTAKDGASGQTALAEHVEVVDPKTGGSTVVAARTGSAVVANTSASNVDEAELEARSRYQAAAMERAHLNLTVSPTRENRAVRARAGILCFLGNVGRRLGGIHYVAEARHVLDSSSGYDVTLKMQRQGPGADGSAATEDPVNDRKPAAAGDLVEVVDPRTGTTTMGRP